MAVFSIGGFDLGYSGERFGKGGYRYTAMLVCTGAETEIELLVTTTPLGAISCLEHALADFEDERDQCARSYLMPNGVFPPICHDRWGIRFCGCAGR